MRRVCASDKFSYEKHTSSFVTFRFVTFSIYIYIYASPMNLLIWVFISVYTNEPIYPSRIHVKGPLRSEYKCFSYESSHMSLHFSYEFIFSFHKSFWYERASPMNLHFNERVNIHVSFDHLSLTEQINTHIQNPCTRAMSVWAQLSRLANGHHESCVLHTDITSHVCHTQTHDNMYIWRTNRIHLHFNEWINKHIQNPSKRAISVWVQLSRRANGRCQRNL